LSVDSLLENKPVIDYSNWVALQGIWVTSKKCVKLLTARTAFATFDESLDDLEKSFLNQTCLLLFWRIVGTGISFFDYESYNNQISIRKYSKKLSLTEGLVGAWWKASSQKEKLFWCKSLQMISIAQKRFENQVRWEISFIISFSGKYAVALVPGYWLAFISLFRKKIILVICNWVSCFTNCCCLC